MTPNGLDSDQSYINIKDLLFSVIKRLGIIILAGILVGGALFSYRFVRRARTNNVLDAGKRLSSMETDVQYQLRVQNINRARDIADTISSVNKQIDHQRQYITDSIYMQIDAENEYESTAQVVLTLENNDTNGLDLALFSAYERDVKAGTFLNEYAAEIGTKPDYIKELISFYSSSSDTTILSMNNDVDRAGSMYIRIYGPSAEFVDSVMDLVLGEVERVSAELNDSVVPHKISVVGVQSIVRIDSATRDGQVNQTARLETLQKQIANYNDSLDTVAEELGSVDREMILEYFAHHGRDEAEAGNGTDAEVASGFKSMIKPAAKLGILGFAAGMVLAVIILVLKYIFASKITTQGQFFSEFTDIRRIGVLKPSGKRSALAKFVDLKTDDDCKMTPENNKKLIAANYDNLTRDCKKVLITGTGDAKLIKETVKALGIKGDVRPDIFGDPDVLKSVPDYDAVVIMEQRNVSVFKDVANEISLLSNGQAEIAGAIII